MAEVISHRFGVVLSAEDSLFSEETAEGLLKETGCKDIRPLYEADEEDDSIL
jgi:hypothetical protein